MTGSNSIGFHLAQAERELFAWRRQLRSAHAQNQQAFLLADLVRVVDDPDPVVAVLLRPMQVVMTQPQQPRAHGREMGNGEIESPIHIHLLHLMPGRCRRLEAESPEDPAQHEHDLHQAELMTCRSQLECGVGTCDAGRLSAGGGLLESWSHFGAEVVELPFEGLGLGLPSIARPSQISQRSCQFCAQGGAGRDFLKSASAPCVSGDGNAGGAPLWGSCTRRLAPFAPTVSVEPPPRLPILNRVAVYPLGPGRI